jgi:hypothetical protein
MEAKYHHSIEAKALIKKQTCTISAGLLARVYHNLNVYLFFLVAKKDYPAMILPMVLLLIRSCFRPPGKVHVTVDAVVIYNLPNGNTF